MTSFKDFSLSPALMKGVDELNFEKPTEIQAKALPILLGTERVDFHGQAQTGTGKTLAFGIPLLNHLDPAKKTTQALVVAPTRELALQICESLSNVARYMNVAIEPIYGGVPMERQLRALSKGVQIVVGTPGRLNDHLRRGTLNLKSLHTLVLDEADIMLDMGFREEIDEILEYASKEREIWLFSATVKPGIAALKKEHMRDPVSVKVAAPKDQGSATQQFYCVVNSRYRLQALVRFIEQAPEFYGFIFAQTKLLASDVAEKLVGLGYRAAALHGDMSQALRNKVIQQFKNREISILVATDVAARGIDVSDVTHVVNYSVPEDQESYMHRIGRTGRAGKSGTSITFITRRDEYVIKQIERKFNVVITPVDVPSIDDLLDAQVKNSLEYLESSLRTPLKEDKFLDELHTTLTAYSKEQLEEAVLRMLHGMFFKRLQQETDIVFSAPAEADRSGRGRSGSRRGERSDRGGERSGGRDRFGGRDANREANRDRFKLDKDSHEYAIQAGREDNVDPADVTKWLTDAGVSKANIKKIRILQRRTFVVVSTKTPHPVLKQLQGIPLSGRRARVSLCQDDR